MKVNLQKKFCIRYTVINMSKLTLAVSCPIDTYSGYGARSRDLVKGFIALDEYEVKIIPQRWGNTRFGYLDDHNEHDLKSRIINKLENKPDIWVQVTVPNEFQPVGKFNIGVTAGIETTVCPQPWIQGLNRMDLILTSSEHSKKVLRDTQWTAKDTNQVLKLEKPIEVLFEGIDLKKYFNKPTTNFNLESVKENFCFLFVGHWLQGEIGHDRKNVGYMIKSFLHTFKNKPNPPALILKTQSASSSIIDRESTLEKINEIRKTVRGTLPSIYLIHGEISDEEMNDLYNHPKVKSMVCLTKGEGFGRPLLEFSIVRKPILASAWSGQVDFLDHTKACLVGGKLDKVHPSALVKDIIIEGSQWFFPNDELVAKGYKSIVKDYKGLLTKAKKLGYQNSQNFSFEAMVKTIKNYLDNYLPDLPKQVPLEIPNLDLPKLK